MKALYAEPPRASLHTGERREDAAQAVAALYERHAAGVYSFMRYRLGNVHLAQELTQTVFEKALRAYASYRADKAKPEVWLFTIARNTLYDHLRRVRRISFQPLEELDLPEQDAGPEQAVLGQEQRRQLARALAALPKRQHQAVSLKYAAGLRNKQVAQVLGITEKHVGVLLHRALSRLKKLLTEEAGDDRQ